MSLFDEDASPFPDENEFDLRQFDENTIDFYAVLNVPRDVCLFSFKFLKYFKTLLGLN